MRPTRTYTFHKYRCRQGHVSQLLVERADILKKQKCKRCGKKAEHTGLVAYRESMTPTVIAENAEGRKLYLGSKDDPIPKGYRKREILPSEIRAFEREVNREMREEHQRNENFKRLEYSVVMRQQIDELKSEMKRMEDKGELSEFDRALAHHAMEQVGGGYSESYSPDFRIRAYND